MAMCETGGKGGTTLNQGFGIFSNYIDCYFNLFKTYHIVMDILELNHLERQEK